MGMSNMVCNQPLLKKSTETYKITGFLFMKTKRSILLCCSLVVLCFFFFIVFYFFIFLFCSSFKLNASRVNKTVCFHSPVLGV